VNSRRLNNLEPGGVLGPLGQLAMKRPVKGVDDGRIRSSGSGSTYESEHLVFANSNPLLHLAEH
jgi:hypothetical protein